jgi:SAM-dependent methyltransferase
MHLYDFLFAWLYDRALQHAEAAGLRTIRREILAGARGRTLEIGAGTGLNLAHYAGAMSLVLSDPSPPMLSLLRRKATGMGIDTEIVRLPARSFRSAARPSMPSRLPSHNIARAAVASGIVRRCFNVIRRRE